MKIIITAGGTSEPIDDVRKITNFSTGRLGVHLAAACLEDSATEVLYLRTPHAQQPPAHPRLHETIVDTIRDLERELEHYLTTEPIAAVIHSMAVSDFRFQQALDHEALIAALTLALENAQADTSTEETLRAAFAQLTAPQEVTRASGKLRSASEALWFYLETNPKIIRSIKAWQPSTLLVGFKLLVDVPESELFAVAQETLRKNQCHYVVANDLHQIQGESHPAFILDATHVVARCQTKAEIARTLVHLIREEHTQ